MIMFDISFMQKFVWMVRDEYTIIIQLHNAIMKERGSHSMKLDLWYLKVLKMSPLRIRKGESNKGHLYKTFLTIKVNFLKADLFSCKGLGEVL